MKTVQDIGKEDKMDAQVEKEQTDAHSPNYCMERKKIQKFHREPQEHQLKEMLFCFL